MKTATCRDCEMTFEIPVRRGRPAVRCEPCKSKTPTVLSFSRKSETGETVIVDLTTEVRDGITWRENAEPCVVCSKTFMRPVKRGRPPTRCEGCQEGVDAAKAAEMTTSDDRLEELFQGEKSLLKGTPDSLPKGAEAQCPTAGKCGRIFTSNTSCDRHKRWLPGGSYDCLDPATLGMEPRERRGIPIWTNPTPVED